jgi:hypothetical protein
MNESDKLRLEHQPEIHSNQKRYGELLIQLYSELAFCQDAGIQIKESKFNTSVIKKLHELADVAATYVLSVKKYRGEEKAKQLIKEIRADIKGKVVQQANGVTIRTGLELVADDTLVFQDKNGNPQLDVNNNPVTIEIEKLHLHRYFEARLQLLLILGYLNSRSLQKPSSELTTPEREALKLAYFAVLQSDAAQALPAILQNLGSLVPYNEYLDAVVSELAGLSHLDFEEEEFIVLQQLTSTERRSGLVGPDGKPMRDTWLKSRSFLKELFLKVSTLNYRDSFNTSEVLESTEKEHLQQLAKIITENTIFKPNRRNVLLKAIQDISDNSGPTPVDQETEYKGWLKYVNENLKAYTAGTAGVEPVSLGNYLDLFEERRGKKEEISADEKAELVRLLVELNEMKTRQQRSGIRFAGKGFQDEFERAQKDYLDAQIAKVSEYKDWKVAGTAEAATPNNISSVDSILRTDLEKLSAEQVYNAGLSLLRFFFSSEKLPKDEGNKEEWKKFEAIMARLNELNETKLATYLLDRIKQWYIMVTGNKKGYVSDYNALLNGTSFWGGFNEEVDEATPFRLLYGSSLNVDAVSGSITELIDGDSFEVEEVNRVRIVNLGLQIIASMYGHFDPIMKKKGEFYATKAHDDSFMNKFKSRVEHELKQELGINRDFSQSEKDAIALLFQITPFVDIRQYVALADHAGGWSPQDTIGEVIGDTAKRITQLYGLYTAIGKGGGVVSSLLVRDVPPEVIDKIESAKDVAHGDPKLLNLIMHRYIAKILNSLYSPHLDLDVTKETEKIVRSRNSIEDELSFPEYSYPMNVQAFWVYRPLYIKLFKTKDEQKEVITKMYPYFPDEGDSRDPDQLPSNVYKYVGMEKGKGSKIILIYRRSSEVIKVVANQATMTSMLNRFDGKGHFGVTGDGGNPGNKTSYKDVLTHGKTFYELTTKLEEGESLSGDPFADINSFKSKMTNITKEFSPIKSVSTVDYYRFAISLYNHIRFFVLAFSMKYHNGYRKVSKNENGEVIDSNFFNHSFLKARLVQTIQEVIKTAISLDVTIDPDDIPTEFRRKFGLPDSKITISLLLQHMIPNAEIKQTESGKIGVFTVKKGISRRVRGAILDSFTYFRGYHRYNEEKIQELSGIPPTFFSKWRRDIFIRLREIFYANQRNPLLSQELPIPKHLKDREDSSMKELLRRMFAAISFPPLDAKKDTTGS